jgi:hypothetical protein
MRAGTIAELYLDNKYVGDVVYQRSEDSWSHGEFHPHPAFAPFAELFGRWSLLMHADDTDDRRTDATRDELRKVEHEIDRLRAKLHFVEGDEWLTCAQVNIDGPLIEWKQY